MARSKQRKAKFERFESRVDVTPYLRITKDMLSSAAWQELDVYEITAYLYFRNEFKKNNSRHTDNGQNIKLTYEQMSKLMKASRFKKSADKLILVGFIDLIEHRPHSKEPTIYGLSNRWHFYGTDHFEVQKRIVLKRPDKAEHWQHYREGKDDI